MKKMGFKDKHNVACLMYNIKTINHSVPVVFHRPTPDHTTSICKFSINNSKLPYIKYDIIKVC